MAGFADFDWGTGAETEDYTQEDGPTTADGFVIPTFEASVDVEQVEKEAAENKFASPEPGTYTFVVVGLLKDPEIVTKSQYVGDQPVTYKVAKLPVKLAVDGHKNLTMIDNIEAPYGDARSVYAFANASKNPDGKNAGFMYRKLVHFLKRLGYNVVEGQPIPPEALALKNWFGRKVIAEVVPGKQQIDAVTNKPKVDRGTGLPYPARPQIGLFSYRESEETAIAAGNRVAGHPAQQSAPQGKSSFVKAGLVNV